MCKDTFPDELIGELSFKCEDMIEKFINTKHQIINLDTEPKDFCTLSNDKLLVASRSSKNLKIYDSNFKLIKTIEKINCQSFTPFSIATNNRNSIYMTEEMQDKIIQCDMDFNFIKAFGTRGSENDQLHAPLDIIFNKNAIFVCDSNNKRIQKLSEDLLFKESYPLNFKPWKIRIIKNSVCIRPTGEPFIAFFSLNPFYLKLKVEEGNGDIFNLNSWFYEYDCTQQHRMRCYNINGELLKEKFMKFDDSKIGIDEESLCLINCFKHQLIIGITQAKKIII